MRQPRQSHSSLVSLQPGAEQGPSKAPRHRRPLASTSSSPGRWIAVATCSQEVFGVTSNPDTWAGGAPSAAWPVNGGGMRAWPSAARTAAPSTQVALVRRHIVKHGAVLALPRAIGALIGHGRRTPSTDTGAKPQDGGTVWCPMSNPSALVRRVDKYDGQIVTCDGQPAYELGSFLGSGATGVYVLFRGLLAAAPRAFPRPPAPGTGPDRTHVPRLQRVRGDQPAHGRGECSPASRGRGQTQAFSAPESALGRAT